MNARIWGLAAVLLCSPGAGAQDAPPDGGPPPTPAQARVARELGENLFREGKFDAALREWDTVLRANAGDPVAWYFRAACHARLRHQGAAIADLDRALALLPAWPPALSLRAGCALLTGAYADAQRDFEACIAAVRATGKAPDPRDVQLLEQAVECQAAEQRVTVGKPAPPVRCHDRTDRSIALPDLLPPEHPPAAVCLLFHGGMRSPNDVAQLARLREHLARIEATGTAVYCISRDPPLENRILAEEKGLAFPLLSDLDGATSVAYGMVDLRRPGADPGTLLGVAIIDAERILRHRAFWLDPEAALDYEALAQLAGKITGTPPPPADDDARKETPR